MANGQHGALTVHAVKLVMEEHKQEKEHVQILLHKMEGAVVVDRMSKHKLAIQMGVLVRCKYL